MLWLLWLLPASLRYASCSKLVETFEIAVADLVEVAVRCLAGLAVLLDVGNDIENVLVSDRWLQVLDSDVYFVDVRKDFVEQWIVLIVVHHRCLHGLVEHRKKLETGSELCGKLLGNFVRHDILVLVAAEIALPLGKLWSEDMIL